MIDEQRLILRFRLIKQRIVKMLEDNNKICAPWTIEYLMDKLIEEIYMERDRVDAAETTENLNSVL